MALALCHLNLPVQTQQNGESRLVPHENAVPEVYDLLGKCRRLVKQFMRKYGKDTNARALETAQRRLNLNVLICPIDSSSKGSQPAQCSTVSAEWSQALCLLSLTYLILLRAIGIPLPPKAHVWQQYDIQNLLDLHEVMHRAAIWQDHSAQQWNPGIYLSCSRRAGSLVAENCNQKNPQEIRSHIPPNGKFGTSSSQKCLSRKGICIGFREVFTNIQYIWNLIHSITHFFGGD